MITKMTGETKKDIHHVSTTWKSKMHFKCLANDHIIHLDKLEKHGGENHGPRPKPLILVAIGGCTGMEIISILDKMRLRVEELQIEVTGELTETLPKMYKEVDILFNLKASEDEKAKIERAINLAVEKYCGVVAMVRHFAKVRYTIQFQ